MTGNRPTVEDSEQMESARPDTRAREGSVRASDEDRERVAKLLRDHFGAGRLSEEELSDRKRLRSAPERIRASDLRFRRRSPRVKTPSRFGRSLVKPQS